MFCENCGNQLSDNAKFCTKCGYKVTINESFPSYHQESYSGGNRQNTNSQSYNYSGNKGMYVEPPSLVVQGDGQVYYVEINEQPMRFCNSAELNNYIRMNDDLGSYISWEMFLSGEPSFMRKFPNALRSFVHLGNGEFPILLIDMTVFGSAKEGLVITNKYIYYNYIASDPSYMKIPLNAIFGVGYSQFSNSIYFFFNDNMYMCPDISPNYGAESTIAAKFADIISIARKL